ncbi:hypothetical protein ACFQUX_25955 [Pantoea stewartii]
MALALISDDGVIKLDGLALAEVLEIIDEQKKLRPTEAGLRLEKTELSPTVALRE